MATAEIQTSEKITEQVPLDITEKEETVEIEASEETAETEVVQEEAVEKEATEQEEYSKSVQKRINQLTKRVKETEREREEAVRFAQGAKAQADETTARLKQLDQSYLSEYGGRITAEQTQVEAELKRAVETGDSQATVDAQRKMTQLAVAADRYGQAKQQQEQQQAAYETQQQQQQQPQPAAAPPQPADPKAEKWANKNSWFGEDYTMTFAAFGIHKKLVEEDGFDPQTDDYYDELDKRIKTEFAHKFKDGTSSKKTAQTVASVSRGNRSGRRKVKLTPSQVTIAKKLGVPLEEYAKYVKE
jgi:hypothetical protein|tara:strand:- start:402 stop:1307 length:906 start_codon:yes stop_codon:yes gene_type:complete